MRSSLQPAFPMPTVLSLNLGQRACVYFLLSLAFLSPFLLHPTLCPFGLHDWAFPCFDAQRPHIFGYYLSPWSERNLGQINPLPFANPVQALLYAAASLSPEIALRCFLLLVAFLAGVGADAAAGLAFHAESRFARLVAGMTYMASPYAATKLVSGHVFFLLDAAVLPFAIVAFTQIREGSLRWWATCGLCIGVLLVKPQFAAMCLLLLPLLAAGTMRSVTWLSLWMLAALIEAPLIFTSLMAYHSGALSNEFQLHAWFANESVPWQHAIDATAYFNKYYLALAGPTTILAWQLVSVFAFAVAMLTSGVLRRLAVSAIVFGLLAAGANGPFGIPLGWLMTKFPPVSLFRELYDLLGLAPLVTAGGVAVGIDLVLRHVRHLAARRSLLASFSIALIGILWPLAGGCAARSVPLVDITPWRSEVAAAETTRGSSRVLWLPAIVPIGPVGTPGGADPFESPIGNHPAAQSYHPSGIFAYAAALGTERGWLPPGLARRLGIGAVILRPELLEDALNNAAHPLGGPLPPRARTLQFISDAGPLALAHGAPACEPALRSKMADGVSYIRCGGTDPIFKPQEEPLASADDPLHGWARGERWLALSSQLADPRWPVFFTLSRKPYRFSLMRRGLVLLYAQQGLDVDGRPIRGAELWRETMLGEGQHTVQPSGGLCALSAAIMDPGESGPATPALETELNSQQSDRVAARYSAWLPPHPKSVLVLREGWSPYWRASIDGLPLSSPFIADGYASGWLLPQSRHGSQLEIRNALLPTYLFLCCVSAFVWIILIVLVIRINRVTH